MFFDLPAANRWVFILAICSPLPPHFKTLFAVLLAEKVAPDGAVPDHAGGRRSAGRRESDWVRCKKIFIACETHFGCISRLKINCIDLINQNTTLEVII